MNKMTQQWLEKQFGSIEDISPLAGGVSSNMYAVSFEDQKTVVIRQITNTDWLQEEPDVLLQEKQQLIQLKDAPIPSPRFIAADPYGEICKVPSLVMSKLPGNIRPGLPTQQFLQALASCAHGIHQIKPSDSHYFYKPYMQLDELEIPIWSSYQTIWKQLYDYLQESVMPSYTPTLIHRDFHLNNILWNKGAISGVVDWINSCIGPRYIDIGHCRWNLAMTYSVEVADTFLSNYETDKQNNETYDVYWDIRALFDLDPATIDIYEGWSELPVGTIDREGLYERMDLYAFSLYRRIKQN